ncbi:hypothetical protein ANCCAN_15075 [Ancylostoma caninum]|uniref:Uncharacterized protein n=1 Tax=Ancylostoma caninum TaxID=29170 RepID=A0A368G3Q9_ANCCA|nr:hypothetical protein ANCCAN_15075 [Ancylostoma caninum]
MHIGAKISLNHKFQADDFSEKVDVRLQSNIQRPLVGQSLVETLPVDERLRSQINIVSFDCMRKLHFIQI